MRVLMITWGESGSEASSLHVLESDAEETTSSQKYYRSIYNEPIERVQPYKYLGVVLSSDMSYTRSI